MWSGSTQGVTSDACPPPGSPFMTENLGHACEAAGITWRTYAEDLPSAGASDCNVNGGKYTRKHDPWANFGNLNHQNERPYPDLAAHIAAGKLPALSFVIPNNCNNTHDCSVATGDSWLSSNVPAMIQAVGRRGIVVVTWDEDDSGPANQILTVIVGDPVKRGYVSTRRMTHYTLLRTICAALKLPAFGSAARDESPITDVWTGAASVLAVIGQRPPGV
jgi:acid phosphatase